MIREEKIKVLAELDEVYFGNTPYDSEEIWRTFEGEPCALKPYLISYDAIIPLIQKQPKEIRLKMFEEKADRVSIMTTPEQLADALIKAVGKWRG